MLFPNPTTGVFTVQLVAPVRKAELIIYDATGRALVHVEVADTNMVVYDMKTFASGSYLVRLLADGFRQQSKLIKLTVQEKLPELFQIHLFRL
jgi:myo-inositol-hexaphosphate 3-phosphohydrolase